MSVVFSRRDAEWFTPPGAYGGEPWPESPRLVIADPWHGFVRLSAACRDGMGGIAHWPDPGGVGEGGLGDGRLRRAGGYDAALDAEQRRLAGG